MNPTLSDYSKIKIQFGELNTNQINNTQIEKVKQNSSFIQFMNLYATPPREMERMKKK